MNLTSVKKIKKTKMTEIWNERNLKAPALRSCIVKGDMQLKQGNIKNSETILKFH